MSSLLLSLIITNALLIIVSTAFALILWLQHRTRMHKFLLFAWLSKVFVFLFQGAAGNNGEWAILLAGMIIVEVGLTMRLYSILFDEKINERANAIIMILGTSLSYAALLTSWPFWLKALPLCVVAAWPPISMGWQLWRRDKLQSLEEKFFAGIIFVQGLHILDFPWLRMEESGTVFGFTVASLLSFSSSVFAPIIIAARMKRNYSDMLEEEVLTKTEQLQQALEDKKDLMKILSHDLAGLLGITYSYTDLALRSIKQNQSPKAVEGLLEKSWNAIKSEVELMQFIRKFGVLEQDGAPLPLQPVSLGEAIERCRFVFTDALQKKNLELVYDPTSMQGLYVMAEPTTLCHSVISNLLSNAIKFSQKGRRIWITAEKTAGDQVMVAVRDEGSGVPIEVIENLFNSKPNASFSRPGTDGETGSGLGLLLVKKTLERYGAELRIVSSGNDAELNKKDPGTSFFIYFKQGANL